MIDKTIQQILDAYNNNKLMTDSDIEDYARKHHLSFESILQCIANNDPEIECCWNCKHITNRYYSGMSSICDNCSRKTTVKDNYEKCDTQFRKQNKPKKIPGTNYTDLRSLLPNTKFRVENGGWCGRIIVKENIRYLHVEETDKEWKITGKEHLIVTILN